MANSARLLAALTTLSCSGSQDSTDLSGVSRVECADGTTQVRIIGGSSAPTLLGLSAAQERAIIALSLSPIGGEASNGPPAVCSGIVVAPGTVLTARHCLDRDGDGSIDQDVELALGPPDLAATARGAADTAWLHPELDVALIQARFLDESGVSPQPLPPGLEVPGESWIGAPVELAGYGETGRPGPTVLQYAVEPIVRLEEMHVVVDGSGRTGACVGDSGGPILARGSDGRISVLGVLDNGDASCVGEDFFTRTDRLVGWEPFDRLVVSMAPTGDAPCEGITNTGGCDMGRALWCEAGGAAVDDCPAHGHVCGWSRSERGFRCVAADEDPCEGAGSHRSCDGDEVVSCESGSLARISCGDCGAVCVAWVDGGGAACAPSPAE